MWREGCRDGWIEVDIRFGIRFRHDCERYDSP
jgi:hypothetical protein